MEIIQIFIIEVDVMYCYLATKKYRLVFFWNAQFKKFTR